MARRGGFPGGMPGNMTNLMKQAQRMQRQMEEKTKELEEKQYTATAGGGALAAESSRFVPVTLAAGSLSTFSSTRIWQRIRIVSSRIAAVISSNIS